MMTTPQQSSRKQAIMPASDEAFNAAIGILSSQIQQIGADIRMLASKEDVNDVKHELRDLKDGLADRFVTRNEFNDFKADIIGDTTTARDRGFGFLQQAFFLLLSMGLGILASILTTALQKAH